ncbi:hypothetical protein PAT3040_06230 [Paenibacillus agaridevorans]|uniref:Methyltransferase FkbM domain-containing protein n=1 Tax=Paenibacillus agaridevorans TaxID=171404 RepID=A0A2R5F592_9BACL|nr:FkbM family methyltransferase [Paenibacillus agaridevorans]GBG11414.1 hypothetical protein PAT3040_06230 [Paenibacillus agaridevorans]
MHKIIMNGTGHAMYVNPGDKRGGRMKRYAGLSQPAVTAFWRKAVSLLEPAIVVDAGANYGEILLSAQYPVYTEIVAIEANEGLRPYLLRSIGDHPNSRQMKAVFAFVSDEADNTISFYVDQSHSGLSSGHPSGSRAVKSTSIGTVTIDSLFQDRIIQGGTLLFKMDVEGFEWQAIKGMSKLLDSCAGAIGCIEFNRSYMIEKGIDLNVFIDFLSERFLLYAPDASGRLIPLETPVHESIARHFNADKTCNDLVLSTSAELVSKLES